MAFERDYTALLERAAEMSSFTGYLDTEDQKRLLQAERAYAQTRDRIAYDILSEKPDLDLVFERVRDDLQQIANENPDWTGTCEFIADDLIEKLSQEAGKSPIRRAIVRYVGPAILAALVIAYFGVWFYKDLTIDQPIETRAGLLQRAAAYEKARDYEDFVGTDTRRGGFIIGLLSIPLEPDEEEFAAANEFVGASLESFAYLQGEGLTCVGEYMLSAQEIGETHLSFVDQIAERLPADAVDWEEPPIATLLKIVAQQQQCVQGGSNPAQP